MICCASQQNLSLSVRMSTHHHIPTIMTIFVRLWLGLKLVLPMIGD